MGMGMLSNLRLEQLQVNVSYIINTQEIIGSINSNNYKF